MSQRQVTEMQWRDVLGVGLAGGLLLVALSAVLALAAFGANPATALIVPGIAFVGALFWRAKADPLVPLGSVLFLAAFALTRSTGVQVIELVFAAYLYTYLLAWYGRRLIVFREPIVRDIRDGILILFPLWVTLSLILALSFGIDWNLARGNWVTFSALWLYFPVREACERYSRGQTLVVSAFVVMASAAFVRNVLALRRMFAEAEYAWEVARARATSNEILILAAAFLCLAIAANSRSLRNAGGGAIGFGVFSLGIILTQWRGYYLALAFGVFVMFLLVDERSRIRLTIVGLCSVLAVAAAAYIVLGDSVTLLGLGLLDRVLSIGTAGTADVSLLNRWFEAEALWKLIVKSPLVGYGIGTSFSFFDATTYTTWTKSYSHNGYMDLWFKFGIIGLTAFMYAWLRSAWDGWRAYRAAGRSVVGLSATVTLIALLSSSLVAAPFTTTDVVLCFAILMGAAVGCRNRASGVRGEA